MSAHGFGQKPRQPARHILRSVAGNFTLMQVISSKTKTVLLHRNNPKTMSTLGFFVNCALTLISGAVGTGTERQVCAPTPKKEEHYVTSPASIICRSAYGP